MSCNSVDFSAISHTYSEAENKAQSTRSSDLTQSQMLEIYEQWTETYDRDVTLMDYLCPQQLAQCIGQLVSFKERKILDVGAGTGLLGTELRKEGFTNIDAVEPSQEMLDKAMELGVYGRHIRDYAASHQLDISDDTYDVVTGAGIFLPGHANGECFEELLRIARPGGLIILVCCQKYYGEEYEFYGDLLDKRIVELVNRGRWEQQSRDTIMYYRDFNAYLTVLRKI